MVKNNNYKNFFYQFGIIINIFFTYIIILNFEIIDYGFDKSIFFSENEKKIVVAFRNDDLSVESDLKHEESVISIFEKNNIKQTFGFIPKTKNTEKQLKLPGIQRDYQLSMRSSVGREDRIELALHGYTHLKGPKTAGEFGGLPFDEQKIRISNGKKNY